MKSCIDNNNSFLYNFRFVLKNEDQAKKFIESFYIPSSDPTNNELLKVSISHHLFENFLSSHPYEYHNDGIAILGPNWYAKMPKEVLNGKGYVNTIPVNMVTNNVLPGILEFSDVDFKNAIQKIDLDSQNATLSSIITYANVYDIINAGPIVLDLDGKGLKMVDSRDNKSFQDFNYDEYLERTGWIDQGMGALYCDANTFQPIEYISHFKYHDINGDGIINAEDPIYCTLKVKTASGQLIPISELGITDIYLNKEDYKVTPGDYIAGNVPQEIGYFKIKGEIHKLYSIWYKVSKIGAKFEENTSGEFGITENNGTAYKLKSANDEIVDFRDSKFVNVIIGGSGNNTFYVNDNGSFVFGYHGSNSYYGGNGNDVFVLTDQDNYENVHAGNGFNTAVLTGENGHYFNMNDAGIQAIYGSNNGDIIISGGNKNTFISGGNGGNILIGGGGDDVINAGNGGDYIYGGGGNNIIRGGTGNDHIYGGQGHNYIEATGGTNHIYGGPTDDIFVAGNGIDYIDGGDGINIVVLKGSYQEYNIWYDEHFLRIEDKVVGRNGSEYIQNVQKITFSDINACDISIMDLPVDLIQSYDGKKPIFFEGYELLNKAINPNQHQLHISTITEVVGGKVSYDTYKINDTKNGIRNIKFTPNENYKGLAFFKYGICNDQGESAILEQFDRYDKEQLKAHVFFAKDDYPKDPVFYKQWYLPYHNVIPIWRDYTGKGVNIGVCDVGMFDYNHYDLYPNVSQNFLDYNIDPSIHDIRDHGTQVAGIIAGSRNDVGIIGIAYDATITPLDVNKMTFFTEFSSKYQKYDIVNNSWGYSPVFSINFTKELWSDFHYFLGHGRNDLGTILVFASGNGRMENEDCNNSSVNSSLFTINVAAINKPKDMETCEFRPNPFSTKGANILISAIGTKVKSTSKFLLNEHDVQFGKDISIASSGTSFSAPIVTGVIALMLEANPYLSVFDVQKILASTARPIDKQNTSWNINSANLFNGKGFHFSNDYGFGDLDAYAAVKLSEKWTSQLTPSQYSCYVEKEVLEVVNPERLHDYETTITINNLTQFMSDKVILDLKIATENLGDVKISVISPSGTESVILDRFFYVPADKTENDIEVRGAEIDGKLLDFKFLSNNFFGEDPNGEWVIKITDMNGKDGFAVHKATLEIFGTDDHANKIMVFTDEFNQIYQDQEVIISDPNGIETLNLAALTGNHIIDLRTGQNHSKFADKDVIIESNTLINNVIGGDGDDILIGNHINNILIGGCGNNTIYGMYGHNIMCGRTGNNALYSGVDADMFVIWNNPGHIDSIFDFKFDNDKEIINIVNVNGVNSYDHLKFDEGESGTYIHFAEQELFIAGIHKEYLTPEHFIFDNRFDFYEQFEPNYTTYSWNDNLIRTIYGLESNYDI